MTPFSLHRPRHPWLWASIVIFVALLTGLSMLGPMLPESGYWALHAFFAPVCHQISERSFHLDGRAMLLCVRCTGVFVGFLLAAASLPALFKFDGWIRDVSKVLVVGSLALICLEWLSDFSGFYPGNQGARFGTGAIFGLVAGYLTVRSSVSSASSEEALPGNVFTRTKNHLTTDPHDQ